MTCVGVGIYVRGPIETPAMDASDRPTRPTRPKPRIQMPYLRHRAAAEAEFGVSIDWDCAAFLFWGRWGGWIDRNQSQIDWVESAGGKARFVVL